MNIIHWDNEPVHLENNLGEKPVRYRYYLVPQINKETFQKNVWSLLEIGVHIPVHMSEYGTPLLIIPEKEGTVGFIMDYRNIKPQLAHNTYPLPIICDTMHKL